MASLLSDAENEFFLGLYRNAVAFYQPRIEKRTGVQLGKISVWDLRELDQHKLRDLEWRTSPWIIGFLRRLVFKSRIQQYAEYLKSTAEERGHSCSALYYKNAIYVSFSIDPHFHEDHLALTAVHELSHALWERIEGRPLHEKWSGTAADWDKYKLLGEGFATYAEQVWFLDIYPPGVKKNIPYLYFNKGGIHYRGFQRVQELIKEHGPELFLEIPKRWNSL